MTPLYDGHGNPIEISGSSSSNFDVTDYGVFTNDKGESARQAVLTYNGNSTNSNIAYGEILDVLTATKTAVEGSYTPGALVTYVVTLRNTGTTALTGLTVTDTGVVNDANPTSSDAILAQSQTLVGMAEQLNAGNGNALRTIALMALAVANDTTMDGLSEKQKAVMARFRNPAMPSVSVTADAAIKIAGSRPAFAQTDTFLEMIGFSQADIRRIKAQETRARGMAVLEELEV